MTNEEAITRLKGLYGNGYSEQEQALDMAISALKNEQTDGDLISRNDVIKMFNTMDRYRADKLILQNTDKEFPINEVFIVDDCYELLEQLHSAEKTAKWRIVGKTTLHYECSKCGGVGDKWDNYCKHCGAKMKESEEE